nr:ABC transporter permease [Spirochaeta isovalerica]
MLGINFGVGCLIAISVVGLAFRDSVNSEMGRYGSTLLWVQTNWRAYASYEPRTYMSERDKTYFESALPGMISIESIFDANYTVSYKGNTTQTTVMGVEPAHFDMFSVNMEQGRLFMDDDIQNKRAVCILRPDIAATLFEDEDPLGKMVTINDRNFKVIGITERMGQGFISDGSDNNTIFVSQDYVATRIWDGRDIKYWFLIMKFDVLDNVNLAQERITHYLNTKYGKLRGEERFQIERLDTYVGMVDKILNIISVLVLVIAVISIVVGGLGIMNIMLVAVTERTREIGIRMAIGATSRDILVQFVIESIALCLIGGGTGIIFGATLAAVACAILEWKFMISLSIVLGALFISTSIGLIFGIYPSYKASKLMPIEALRSEV